MLDVIRGLIDLFLHLDSHLAEFVQAYGVITYAVLFIIIFAETGFVVTPFLPGDSLLFAAGAIAAIGSLNVWFIVAILIVAAIAGDSVNYWIGHFFGQKIVDNPKFKFINQSHIEKTERFYQKYGGKTIILARFVPIVRTFAPFIAGVGSMHYRTFFAYNIIGGVLWVSAFTLVGYFFGNIPSVKHNFSLVILAILLISVLPIGFEFIKSRRIPQTHVTKK